MLKYGALEPDVPPAFEKGNGPNLTCFSGEILTSSRVRVEGDEGESCVSLCVWGLAIMQDG